MIEELTHGELLAIRLALEHKRAQLIRTDVIHITDHGHAEARTADLLIEKARLENLQATLRQRQRFERQLTSRRTGFTRAL
jgi:hypothetical protein